MSPFGIAVRALRKRYSLRQKQMAAAMGISPTHLSAMEKGDRTVSKENLRKAKAFFRKVATTQEVHSIGQTQGGSTPLQTLIKTRSFGEDLVIARNQLSMSAKAFAEALGRSAAWVSAIENGNRPLKQEKVDLILGFLGPLIAPALLEKLRSSARRDLKLTGKDYLSPDAVYLMSCLERRLRAGDKPPAAVRDWLTLDG